MKHTYGDEIYHYTRDEQEVLVRAGFRCQICNERVRPMFSHTRTTGSFDPANMLVLCEDCYDLAQIGKQRAAIREGDQLLMQIALLACLFLVIALVVVGLASISPLVLIVLCFVAFFLAFLIVVLLNAFRA